MSSDEILVIVARKTSRCTISGVTDPMQCSPLIIHVPVCLLYFNVVLKFEADVMLEELM